MSSTTNLSPVLVQRGRSVVSFHPLSRCTSVTSIRSKILDKSADTQAEDGGSSDGSCKCDECWKRTESEKINHSGMESRYLSDLRWRMSHSVNIYLYRNGVEGEKPCLVHIPPNALKNMKTLMNVIQERLKMKILVGYAKKLYRMDGGILRHPCELTMYNNYVVATNFDKCFKSVSYGRQKSPLMILHSESKHARVLRRNDTDQIQINTSRIIKGQGDEKLPYMYKEFDDEIGGSGDCGDCVDSVYESDQEKCATEYKYPSMRKADRAISNSARHYNEKAKAKPPVQLHLPPLTPKKNFQQKSKPPPAINSYRPVENKKTEFTFGQKNIVQQHQQPHPIRPVFPPQAIRTNNNNVLKLPALSARQQQQQQPKLTGRLEKKLFNNKGFNSSKSTTKSVSKATQTESLTGVQRILERCAGLAALGQPGKLFPTQQQFDPFKMNYFNQPGGGGGSLSPFDQFFLSQMQINAQQAAWQSNGISFSNISAAGPTSWTPSVSSQDFSTFNSANLRNSNPSTSFMNPAPTGGYFSQNFNQLNGNGNGNGNLRNLSLNNNIYPASTKPPVPAPAVGNGNGELTSGITGNPSSWSNNTSTTNAGKNNSSDFGLSRDIISTNANDMSEKARRGPRKKRRRL